MVDESLLNEKRDRVRRRGVASRHVTFGLDRGVVVGTLWLDFAAGVGMPNVMFHALRHTHASQLIDEGVDIITSGKRLGGRRAGHYPAYLRARVPQGRRQGGGRDQRGAESIA
jgi:integrase